jgi:hypothetical protein
MIPRDTSPEAWAVQLEVYRRMSGAERFEIAFDMSQLVRELALAGLRREHPDWAERDLQLELLRRWYPSCSLPTALP